MNHTTTSTRKASPLRRVKWVMKRKWRTFRGYSKKKKACIIASPIIGFLVIVPIATYAYYYNDISNQARLMNANNTGVVLLDDTGKPFYTVGRAEHRDIVPLNKISSTMQHALIASEDKDFYKNNGFSFTGIARAAIENITSGSIKSGGSTITQQLAKNTLLSNNRTFLRKYQEVTVSVAIDHRYSKDQILDMYLNSVFFGGTNFGIEQASAFYFNTTPDKLDLAQSAMLVGILPAPNAYSPTLGNRTYAVERQSSVLGRMVASGYITQAQANAAKAEQLQYAAPSMDNSSIAPHFAETVMNQLDKKYGAENVLRSGYQVKTSLDITMQNQLNQSVQAHLGYIQRQGGSNAAAIAVDPSTGEVKALVGSVDYDNTDFGKVDMTATPRQPGSSFKTIYYSAAFDNGTITPATILKDVPTDFGGYAPLDADKRFRGNVTARQAINQSLNIPSVEVMQKFGVSNAIAAAKKYGITTINTSTNYGLSLALGTAEVPLSQMTNAYAAIANGGTENDQVYIKQINDKFGKSIFTSQQKSHSTISPQAAWLTSDVLSDYSARAPIFGSSLSVPGHEVAVKTGTTDDDRDAWTIGYTPKVAVGVWVGNNNNDVMRDGGSDMAGPIWVKAMTQYLAGTPKNPYKKPSGITERPACTGTGSIASTTGINTYTEYFLFNHLPSGRCTAEQKPVLISVCDLATKQMIEINQNDYDSTTQSKNPSDCQPTTEQVCDLSTGQVITINQSDYDSTKYSKDTSNCAPPATLQVCNLSTGQIITINQSDYDTTKYSKDLTKCQQPTPPPTPTPTPTPKQ